MSLIAALSIEVGASIAKSILKIWFKNSDIAVDTTSTIVDMLKAKTTDRVAQQRAQRQFETIGEKVGESLLPIFEVFSDLDEGSRIAVALANEILQEVSRMRKQLNSQEKEAQEAAHFELEYRRAVLRNLDILQLFGTDVVTSSRRHRLSVAYVMLSVKRKARETVQQESQQGIVTVVHGDARDETLKSPPQPVQKEVHELLARVLKEPQEALKSQAMIIPTATKSVLSVDEALARSKRLLIQGLAGSGKTTSLQ